MLCHPDVFRLSALVATAKQNDDHASTFLKVDAVTGTIVDTQFADALANRLGVAGIPLGQPIQSRSDNRTSPVILEPQAPLSKRLCLLQLKHV